MLLNSLLPNALDKINEIAGTEPKEPKVEMKF